MTHVVPIVNGYVVGPAIQSMPLAGSTITSFIEKRLEERGETMLQNKKLPICRCGTGRMLQGTVGPSTSQ